MVLDLPPLVLLAEHVHVQVPVTQQGAIVVEEGS